MRLLLKHELSLLSWVNNLQSVQFDWNIDKLNSFFESSEIWIPDLNQTGIDAFILAIKLPGAVEILALATKPQEQSQGLMGRLLRNFAMHYSLEADIWLEVHELNLNALGLYQKLGFIQVGKRKSYYQDGAAAIMLSLSSTST